MRSLILLASVFLFGCALNPIHAEPSYQVLQVAPEVERDFTSFYNSHLEQEDALCLHGFRVSDTVFVESYTHPSLLAVTDSSVRYESCPTPKYLGAAHLHVLTVNTIKFARVFGTMCYQSETDKRTFDQDKKAVVEIVICGQYAYFWKLKNGPAGIFQRPNKPD